MIIKHGGHEDQLSHKYFAMDFFRVKSMLALFQSGKLKEHYQLATQVELEKKIRILQLGYRKHQNLQGLQQLHHLLMGTCFEFPLE